MNLKNIQNMNKILYLLSSAVILFVSCQKQPPVKTTAIAPMDGEWTVKMYDMTGVWINTSRYTIYTSNTANNDNDTLLLRATLNATPAVVGIYPNTSTLNGAPILGKVVCNVSEKTFSITDGTILLTTLAAGTPNTFTISGGKVLLNAAHPPSGATADSITFVIEKRGAGTTQYRVSGFRKTLWPEDAAW